MLSKKKQKKYFYCKVREENQFLHVMSQWHVLVNACHISPQSRDMRSRTQSLSRFCSLPYRSSLVDYVIRNVYTVLNVFENKKKVKSIRIIMSEIPSSKKRNKFEPEEAFAGRKWSRQSVLFQWCLWCKMIFFISSQSVIGGQICGC